MNQSIEMRAGRYGRRGNPMDTASPADWLLEWRKLQPLPKAHFVGVNFDPWVMLEW